MAQVNTDDGGGGGGHGKHQKKRAKKSSTHIDMTPMVDLAFLLLTFFVMTSTFSKPKTMEVNYPADLPPGEKPPPVKNAVTFVLTGNDNVYYYEGQFYPANNTEGKLPTQFVKTNYSKDGLRKVLTENRTHKQTLATIKSLEEQYLRKEIADTTYKRKVRDEKGKWEALTVLIKSDDMATYRNVIDVMDELNINQVGKYAVVDMQQGELDILNTLPK